MDYFIGIDGGGTKTAFTLYNELGNTLNHIVLPSCHVLQTSDQQAIEILKQGVFSLLPDDVNYDHVYIGCGLAGYGNDASLRNMIEYRIENSFNGMHYAIANDAQIGLMGALDGKEGIFIIAGTGSMGLSYQNYQFKRVGGWGYTLGDEGSAYWLAKQLLQEYTMQVDGRKPRTTLVDSVKKNCDLSDDYDIISYVNTKLHNKRDEVAFLAPLVFKLAQNHDEAALQIYANLAHELSLLINTLARDFKGTVNVSYTGGVWKGLSFIVPYLTLNKNVKLCEPLHDPCYGAYLIAKQIRDSKV